ncbi:hypothetical protein K1719_037114 [Acacia pycnantha]|nr:hypothetical protein K1719_037114 [Acacia pycnantha]
MFSKLSISTCYMLMMFLASSVSAAPKMFDIIKYGGVPNGDITQAITKAWKDACASEESSKVMVPRGKFTMRNSVDFEGPCKAPIELKVDGTIQGPKNPSDLKGAETWINFHYISDFTLSGSGTFDGLGVTDPWKEADCANTNLDCKPYNLAFNFLNNSAIRGLTTKDSRNFHVNILSCNNLIIDGFTVTAPGESVNTDGLHISRCFNVSVINTKIGTGDDCISLGDGNTQLTVENVYCGPGHGISVGSLGGNTNELPVKGFTVRNCTFNGTTNGVRVKTWADKPGTISVSNLLFEDITMINVQYPIIIDQEYCPSKKCLNKMPSKIQVSDVTFRNIRGTSELDNAVVLNCSKGKPCKNIKFDNVDLKLNNGSLPFATCANVKPIQLGKTSPYC